MPLPLLIALFVVLPIAELYAIYLVGDAIGIWWTLALLALDSLLGSVLLRSQGRAVWRRFSETLAAGRVPQREILDGVLVIFGGAFLITPGFLTDILGLMLLIPPTRAVIRRQVSRRLGRRAVNVAARRADPERGEAGHDVEGSATEYDAPTPRLER